MHDLEPGEVPRHRAVLQRHDPVAEPGIAQRLRADDAARAAAAIDDDRRIGRRHQVGEAIDQLGAGYADRARNAVVLVFLIGPAVEDRDIGAAVDQGFQVGRGNPRRAGLVLDDFGERLARDVHAAIDAVPGRLPGRDAAVEHRHIRIAERSHAPGGEQCRTVAVVAPHDSGGAARHQIVDEQFQPAQRHARRQQQVAPAENALLARVEQGDLAAIVQLRLQIASADALDVVCHVLPSLDAQSRAAGFRYPSRVCGSLRPSSREATSVRRICAVPPPIVNMRASRTMRSSGRLRE